MSKKEQIWKILADGQPHSAKELISITHRFSAVIHSLREEGYDIETITLAHNEFAYQLVRQAVVLV
jgi:biotin operon repressor